ncbi:MAG: YwqG family protein [Pseudomonadota bacterium]
MPCNGDDVLTFETPEEIVEAIRKEAAVLARPFTALIAPGKTSTDLTESRFGGAAVRTSIEDWPLCFDGRPMTFLTQINCQVAPMPPGFPKTGLLQFFVKDDPVEIYDAPLGGGAAVRHVQSFENLRAVAQPKPDDRDSPYTGPVEGLALRFETGTMRPDPYGAELRWLSSLFQAGEDKYPDGLSEEFDADVPSRTYLGGFPRSTQGFRNEPDEPDLEDSEELAVTLLQIGSGEGFMWGDLGEASFMLSDQDLRDRKFERADFNWDCH